MRKFFILFILPVVFVLVGFGLVNSSENKPVEQTEVTISAETVENTETEVPVKTIENAARTAKKEVKPANEILNGKASYYADKYHGRTTANGETFDKRAMTAAHKSLPFNTNVKVTNLDNGKSVVVRINDRGPYIKGRIIDLSEKAAEDIGMIRKGVVNVEVEILEGR